MASRDNIRLVNQLIAGTGADAATRPSVAFGDADTGFFEQGDDEIRISINGASELAVNANGLESVAGGGPGIYNETSTSTNPTILPNISNSGTGIGANSTTQISLIVDSPEVLRISGTEMFIPNGRSTAPTTTAGGGYLYVSGGSLQFTGSSGTTTRLAAP